MAQYTKIILKMKSGNAPDWGIGKGVIASFIGKLEDNNGIAAMQINSLKDDIIHNNIEVIAEPTTEEEYNKKENGKK